MELKVLCDCGQKFKFDVEPVGGLMPFQVNCPACGVDRTGSANELLTLQTPIGSNVSSAIGVAPPLPATSAVLPPTPPPIPGPAPAPGGLRINRPAPSEPPTPPPVSAGSAPTAPPAPRRPPPGPMPTALPKYMQTNQAIQNNNFFMGILGAVLGAIVGLALMLAVTYLLRFRLPYFGTIIGAITGYGARLFYRGTDYTLGVAAAVVALFVVGGWMVLLYSLVGAFLGAFVILSYMFSLIFAVWVAFKVASG